MSIEAFIHQNAFQQHRKVMCQACLLAFALFYVGQVFAESSVRSISVDYPRALSLAADQIRRANIAPISYEDPPYEYSGDIVDVTQWIRTDMDRYPPGEAPKVIVPRMCQFESEYRIDIDNGFATNLTEAVQQVVEAYNAGDNPGKFEVQETAIGPCIVPTQVKDSHGQWQAVTSILDCPVTLALTNVSNHMALRHLVNAIEAKAGEKIHCSAIMQEREGITLSADNEPARSVLARLLAHDAYGHYHNYWELLFQPQPRAYHLNLYFATGLPYTPEIPSWAAAMRTSNTDRVTTERK